MPSNRTKKTRFQPTMNSLESRCMADAKMVGALIAPVGGAIVARPVPVEVGRLSMTGQAGLQVATPSVAAGYQYTAITITNSSTARITYNFKWGNGAWTSYTLTAGQKRVQYISALNQKATISFDKSFTSGLQEQRYSLAGNNVTFPAGFYLVQPTPSISSGRAYTFRGVSNGVQLYS